MSNQDQIKIESLTLDDGRKAERHTSIDEHGNQVIEIFAEEARPLKLEKRIVRERKNIISKETHETIKDGEVSYQEVRSLEPEVPIQIVSRVGVVDHAKTVNGDYVRKEEIGKIVEDGVIAGIATLLENYQPVLEQTKPEMPKAQEMVEANVEKKKQSENNMNLIIGVLIVVQVVVFAAYYYLNA